MMSYIAKIRAKVSIFAAKKTSNVFDGSYHSIYKGNGMNFEELREYIPGDNIRDIDWKASSRSAKLLVKRYIAEKKHNLMLVLDSGEKMHAHTKSMQEKKEVALNAGGTVAYLASKNGDNVGAIFNQDGMVRLFPLKAGMNNLEQILTEYDKAKYKKEEGDLEKCFQYLIKNIKRRMILVVVTDAAGIRSISDNTLKKLTYQHDVLFIDISDADVTDGRAYDIEKDVYVPEFISQNKKLNQLEKETKQQILEENERKLIRHKVVTVEIDNEEQIVDKVIELLERHKYANNR